MKPEAPETRPADPFGGERRYLYLALVAHNHILDNAPSVDEEADLPPHILRYLHDIPGSVERYDARGLKPSFVEFFESSLREMVKTLGISVYVYGNAPVSMHGLASSALRPAVSFGPHQVALAIRSLSISMRAQ